MANKRKGKRFDCAVPVEGKVGTFFDQTKTVDFSKKGLGFVMSKKVPLNRRIPMEIDFGPDYEPALVIGTVKWTKHIRNSNIYRVGIYFETLLRGSKSRIVQYFKSKF